MEISNKQGQRFAFSDNKLYKMRKEHNYRINLRQHDMDEHPLHSLLRQHQRRRRAYDISVRQQQPMPDPQRQNQEEDQVQEQMGQNSQPRLIVHNFNPYMQILGIIGLTMMVVLILCISMSKDQVDAVSNCFMKFKELSCSVVRPSDQCKIYLECLQRINKSVESAEGQGFKYYAGIIIGVVGLAIKKYFGRFV